MSRQDRFERRKIINKKPLKRLIVIVCCQTEAGYFEVFNRADRDFTIEIYKEKQRTDPENIYKRAVSIKAEIEKDIAAPEDYEVWGVIDKDNFTTYDSIISRNEDNIFIAYSNPCFEVWYHMHFPYSHAGFENAGKCCSALKSKLGVKYDKSEDFDIWGCLENSLKKPADTMISEAIDNAKKLQAYHKSNNTGKKPSQLNPDTNIHELVDKIK